MVTAEPAAVMGKILTRLIIANRGDEVLVERGMLSSDHVRSATLDDVLVDTGATTLCLPREVVAQLGLSLLKEVAVSTASGAGTARIFQDAKITIQGRQGTFECLELPGGTQALIGVIPLEALGIELDLQRQTLRLLSDGPNETYYTVL